MMPHVRVGEFHAALGFESVAMAAILDLRFTIYD